MDPSRFDHLTRSFATSGTRRWLVRLVAALPLGAVLAIAAEDAAAAERPHERLLARTPQRNRKQRNTKKNNNNKNNKKNNKNNNGGRGGATCTVCPTSRDCPHTSVQAAHDAANAGDTLTLCAGTYTESVMISKPLTLASHPGHNVVLQGAGSGSVVTIQSGVTTTLTKVFISGGTGTLIDGTLSGGGIVNFGTLTLNGGTVVESNTAARGGGIYNATNGTLEMLDDSTFVARNTASSDGGGIYNARGATLTIDNAVVGKNTATGNGGGIFNSGGLATVKIQNNAQIEENTAAQGAGIYTDIGFDSPGTTIVTIIDSSVTQNQASQAGGGIFNVAATVSLQTSTVFNNVATITGGGILNTEGGVVTFDAQSAVLDNRPNNCVGTDACPA